MYSKSEIQKVSAILENIAMENHTTVEDVRLQIKGAMIAGMCSSDPKAQAQWKEISCEGDAPTPEELILWAAQKIKRQ